MDHYWQKTLQRRLSRRRVLAATGGLTASAAFLAACGSDSDDSGDGSGASGSTGLLASYEDTTSKAVKGGKWQGSQGRDSDHFDPLTGTQATLAHTVHAYNTLLSFKEGTVFNPPDGSVVGDLAASYEMSPDRTEVILKLRPGVKFDPRPPTNSRVVTVQDVQYSFNKWSSLSPNRGNVLNSVSPDLPVIGVTTPDASTIVVKLAHPDASILSMLAWSWFLNVAPVEADGQFDPRAEMRGTGPWMLTRHEPSVGWSYERNPNWRRANERPFLDGIEYALIPETAAIESQFNAGTLWSYNPPAESVLPMKRQKPDARLFSQTPTLGNRGYRAMGLSKKPDSPLQKDVRLRRAISMLIDRDGLNEVFGNITTFESNGVEVESVWHSHTPASWNTIWLDPKAGKLGDASKYFHHNPQEAANLLKAAGAYGSTIEYASWANMIASWGQQVEVVAQMLQGEGHFVLDRKVMDYSSEYQPKYNRSTLYDGIASFQVVSGLPDWNMTMWNVTAPGVRNAYINAWEDVPGLRDIMVKHRDEADPAKRISIAQDWQKLLANEMPYIPYSQPDGAATFSFAQPWFGNFGVYKSWGSTTEMADVSINYWHDKSKQA
jgi:ABC-type transport system substrate-binding protein